jgi:hypothetical protein
MVALAFIMIHVGYEFELDKTDLRQYGVTSRNGKNRTLSLCEHP